MADHIPHAAAFASGLKAGISSSGEALRGIAATPSGYQSLIGAWRIDGPGLAGAKYGKTKKMCWVGWGSSMWVRVSLAAACLAGLLSACAIVDPVDSRYDTVGRSLARARDQAIFLNLVRASHDYPLSFTTVSNVTPSLTNVSQFSLPTFIEGPLFKGATPIAPPYTDFLANNNTASNSTSVSTNFSVSTQETSAFYEGFLRPIDLTTLDYFIRQGYSHEMLFWLFTDSVEVTIAGSGTYGFHYDPPRDYGCPKGVPGNRCFIDFVRLATATGLTVEEKTLQSAEKGGGGGGGGSSGGSKTTTTVYPRFCFNRVLATRAQRSMSNEDLELLGGAYKVQGSPRCGDPWDPVPQSKIPQPDTFKFSVGTLTFRITPRSAYGVFEFLGAVLKAEREHLQPLQSAYIPMSRRPPMALPSQDVTVSPTLSTVDPSLDRKLIYVLNGGGADCFSHTWFYDGDYCVPQEAATTKRIFGLLAQLIAIETAASDLSITPVVRIIQ
jgi:hypothetical protein